MQALPGASEGSLVMAEDVISQLGNVSTLVQEIGAEGIIDRFIGEVKVNEYHPKYNCLCSREYIEKVLISLGKEELNDILEKEKVIKVDCQFCDKIYEFNKDDVDAFFSK